MTYLDYQAPAALFLGSDWKIATEQGPRAFSSVAKALRFALEEAPPVSLHGARLVVGDRIFAGDELGWLYRSQDYPLPRKPPVQSFRRAARLVSKETAPWKSSTTTPWQNSIPAGASPNRNRPSTGASTRLPTPSAI